MFFRDKYQGASYIEYDGSDAIVIVKDKGNSRTWKNSKHQVFKRNGSKSEIEETPRNFSFKIKFV